MDSLDQSRKHSFRSRSVSMPKISCNLTKKKLIAKESPDILQTFMKVLLSLDDESAQKAARLLGTVANPKHTKHSIEGATLPYYHPKVFIEYYQSILAHWEIFKGV